MKRQELLELVAFLTAKNMALEKEIKRLEKQTRRLWEDLNGDLNPDEEFDFDWDEDPRVLDELKAGMDHTAYEDDYSPSSDLDVPDYDESNYPSKEEKEDNDGK